MKKPFTFAQNIFTGVVAPAILAAGAILPWPAQAKSPASSGQQAPAFSSQQTSTPGTPNPTAKASPQPKAPATAGTQTTAAPAKKPAAQSENVYRDLKPADGIEFVANVDSMELPSAGRPSGVLKRFALLGKDSQLIDLELADTHFVDGRIKTKLFGEILASSTSPTTIAYQATESQIRKIRRFLATHPSKPNVPQATASGKLETPSASTQQGAPAATAPQVLNTDKDKISYAIGMNIGTAMKRDGLDVDTAILLRGLQDALAGGKLLLTEQEVQGVMTALQADLRKKQELQMQQVAEENKKEGDAFLAANKMKEGVVALASGLQYKILQEGTGPKPAATDTVTVNYRGTLLNGTEFDSSYKRGQSATFPVGQIIKGWTEALQLMPVGSKWQLFIPSDLAYGARAASRDIGPNSTLIFEVELLSIQPKAAPAHAPAPAPPAGKVPAPSTPSTSTPTPKPAPAPTPTPTPPAPTPKPDQAPPPTPTPTSTPKP